MDVIKRKTIKSVDKNVEKLEPSDIAGRNIKRCSHFGKEFGSISKVKIELPKERFYTYVYTHKRTDRTEEPGGIHLNQLAPVISQHTLFKAVCNALFSPVFSGIFKLQ